MISNLYWSFLLWMLVNKLPKLLSLWPRIRNTSDLWFCTLCSLHDVPPHCSASTASDNAHLFCVVGPLSLVVGQALKFFKKKLILLNLILTELDLVVDVFLLGD